MVNKCQAGAVISVLVSVMVAVGLGAAFYVTQGSSQTTSPNSTTTVTTPSKGTTTQTPCDNGPQINVTLRVENGLVDEYFNHSVEIRQMRQGELILFLQKAADVQEEFRFSARYGAYGYYITTMNGLTADVVNKTWWKISDGNGAALNLGVSSYIPQNDETIVFSFVQGYGDGH